MKSEIRIAVAFLFLAGGLLAQGSPPQTIYFSTRFAETPASGRAGDLNSIVAPCGSPTTPGPLGFYAVESALANSEGISYVEPGVVNMTVPFTNPPVTTTDYVEIWNFPQSEIVIGDLDADGIPHESSNFPGVDAIWIPFAAFGRPNTIHEMFVSSFSDSTGSAGTLGVSITEADMVLFRRNALPYPATATTGATPVFFIRQADWEALFGLAVPNNSIDVDAFTVDTNGDIYASFDGTTGIANALLRLTPAGAPTPTTITRGDVIRIPRAAYTPGPNYGEVTAPLAGFAERVLTQAEVAAMVTTANGPGGGSPSVLPVNTYSLDTDPNGGMYVSPTTGFAMTNLLFTVDSSGGAVTAPAYTFAPAIYSTNGGGTFAIINGTVMSSSVAMGYRPISFNNGFYAGAVDALDVVTHTPSLNPFTGRPLHIDAFPVRNILSTNGATYTGHLTGYVSNAAPGASIAVFAGLYVVPTGGFVPRWDVSPYVTGYPDLYVDFLGVANTACAITPAGPPFDIACQVPAAQALLNGGVNPIATWVDPINGIQNGDCCFDLDLSGVVPIGALATSPPVVIVFQALDLSLLNLSTPLYFQLN